MLDKSGSNKKTDLKKLFADNAKRADENGGISLMSLDGFSSQDIVEFMSQPNFIFFDFSVDDD
jgi:hypothetical protein